MTFFSNFCLSKKVNDEKIQGLFQPETLKAVQKDYEYLRQMKEMDMKIISQGEFPENKEGKTGFQMTDVVPVGGLIMARFQIFCNLVLLF